MFSNFDVFDIDVSERDRKSSQVNMEIWTSFVKDGIPLLDTEERPGFEANNQSYLLLDKKIEVKNGLSSEKVVVINEAYVRVRNNFYN